MPCSAKLSGTPGSATKWALDELRAAQELAWLAAQQPSTFHDRIATDRRDRFEPSSMGVMSWLALPFVVTLVELGCHLHHKRRSIRQYRWALQEPAALKAAVEAQRAVVRGLEAARATAR